MSLPRPIRIAGVGSPHGDDALGWEVVRQLQKRTGWDYETCCVDGGQRLLDLLDGQGSLLIIDAVVSGSSPGTVFRFESSDRRIESLRPGSTHELRPLEALRLAESLGLMPRRVLIFGVEAAQFGPESGLSPAVLAAIPNVVECIAAELNGVAGA
jgi:hydrogenase maturation protease